MAEKDRDTEEGKQLLQQGQTAERKGLSEQPLCCDASQLKAPKLRELYTLELCFQGLDGRWYEPTKPWRRARMALNVVALIALVLVAFQPLQGSWQHFFYIALLVLLILVVFGALSYLLLKKARYQEAREAVQAAKKEDLGKADPT